MKFHPLHFRGDVHCGAKLVITEPVKDNRGKIARIFDFREFDEEALEIKWVQIGTSTSKKGVVRGFHRQPKQDKFYYVLKGEIWDVLVDGLTLVTLPVPIAEGTGIYIPHHLFHGFQALKDNTQVLFFTSEFYDPDDEQRIKYDYIKWPLEVTEVSKKDRA